jgi:hypothetical protein
LNQNWIYEDDSSQIPGINRMHTILLTRMYV